MRTPAHHTQQPQQHHTTTTCHPATCATRVTPSGAWYPTRTGRAAQRRSVGNGVCPPCTPRTRPVRTQPGVRAWSLRRRRRRHGPPRLDPDAHAPHDERRFLSSRAIRYAHQRSRAPAQPPHGPSAAIHHAPPNRVPTRHRRRQRQCFPPIPDPDIPTSLGKRHCTTSTRRCEACAARVIPGDTWYPTRTGRAA